MERSKHRDAPGGKETRVEKARRLVREGRVHQTGPSVYEVIGDTGRCFVSLEHDAGSCRANAFDANRPCSHRISAELYASAGRRAA